MDKTMDKTIRIQITGSEGTDLLAAFLNVQLRKLGILAALDTDQNAKLLTMGADEFTLARELSKLADEGPGQIRFIISDKTGV